MTDHAAVLLEEAITALNIRQDGIYLDATYGRGGHSRAIAGRLSPQGRLIAIDRDPEAVRHGRQHPPQGPRFDIAHSPFSRLRQVQQVLMPGGRADGILADLGVSSPQLGDAERGFAFNREGPLDMRMDPDSAPSAREWIAAAEQSELKWVIKTYGEEKFAGRIARAIVDRRADAPIDTTRDLAELIAQHVPAREPGRHPATRTFQAIRMHINDELGQLQAFLPQAVECLGAAGRLVVISFHSLEDRIVKRFMRDEARGDPFPKDLPIAASELQPRLKIIGKPVRPSREELQSNRRARSAIMRVAERTEAAHA
ncbi:MAG: 16S rRNA (cytosine(1402)-N(4))-methyltransferase RsmH [Gammaproteobacteria bacterium]|nr:16S rRNA (cytosine(1402)-N(4))-methyltransferase RsmH [Gammaproteobacteria bacterium]